MARGNWSQGSDYDLFVGLNFDDGKRMIDRMLDFPLPATLTIEIFPYEQSSWLHMFKSRHLLLLEVLEHGIVLWDTGAFANMQTQFQTWRARGEVIRTRNGWKLEPQQ